MLPWHAHLDPVSLRLGNLTRSKASLCKSLILRLDNTNVQAFLDGQVSGLETALELNGRLEATIKDMAKFSGIIDQPIRGRSEITATGGFAFLSGAFDLDIVGTGNGLAIGQRVVDKFLVGANRFTGSVKRNVDGLFIDAARISNPQISATASGSAKGDQANARIDATLNNAAMLSDALSGSMTLNGTVQRNGALADLDLTTTGVGGLTAKIDGQIPMNGQDWRITAKGRAPLALSDSFVDTSVVTVRGNAEFDLRLSQPKLAGVSGTISTNNAQIILPNQKLTLNAVNSNMSIVNGNGKVSATASESFGGAINASGTVSLSDAQNPTADMVIDIRNLLRKDRTFYSTVLNGTVGFVGPISGGARISGRVDLTSTKVNIAGTGQSTLSFLPSVQHKGQPAAVLQTRKRAGLVVDPSDTQTNSRSRPHLLDLLISAPSKVFVTGRGLNAEFAGSLRLRGTTDNVQPSGFFGLVRGRMNLLGKQFALTSGAITLSGSFDPRIQIDATTTSGEYQTTIVVSGLVSDPEITFRSIPELPEEEVFAQLLFGKGIQQISPFQALQLASALRELSGKRVPSFVRSIRRNLALDDFNINVDEDGSAQVTAGKYVSENVYTDVTIAEDGKSEVTINLDVNKNITVRGAVSESGNSSIGVFFEKDY